MCIDFPYTNEIHYFYLPSVLSILLRLFLIKGNSIIKMQLLIKDFALSNHLLAKQAIKFYNETMYYMTRNMYFIFLRSII